MSHIYNITSVLLMFTAPSNYRPRQGNIFTPVCDSVHRGGLCPGVVSVQRVSLQGRDDIANSVLAVPFKIKKTNKVCNLER